MPLEVKYVEGEACPMCRCDGCDAEILKGDDGRVVWIAPTYRESDRIRPLILCGACDERFLKRQVTSWDTLSNYLRDLCFNLGVARDPEEKN